MTHLGRIGTDIACEVQSPYNRDVPAALIFITQRVSHVNTYLVDSCFVKSPGEIDGGSIVERCYLFIIYRP